MRISDWGSDVCSSDLGRFRQIAGDQRKAARGRPDGEVARFEARSRELRAKQLVEPGARAGLHPRRDLLAAEFEKDIGHCKPSEPRTPFASSEVEKSEEHTSELQSLMRRQYAGFCLKKKHITL